MHFEVLGQVGNPPGQQRHLGFRRSGVGLMQAVRAQDFFFLIGSKRHENISINRSAIIDLRGGHRELQHAHNIAGKSSSAPTMMRTADDVGDSDAPAGRCAGAQPVTAGAASFPGIECALSASSVRSGREICRNPAQDAQSNP
jgi:hypothetical protein